MNLASHNAPPESSRGFTLVEVLVSLALFMVVVTISVGTMLVLIDANAKARTVQTLVNNVSYTLDSMTREIRQGYAYNCGGTNAPSGSDGDCSSDTLFSFSETGGSLTSGCSPNRVAYRLNNDSIERRICNGSWQAVTSDEVVITRLEFQTSFTSRTDDKSPVVTIVIEGEAGEFAAVESDFQLQTSVTQRRLDLPPN